MVSLGIIMEKRVGDIVLIFEKCCYHEAVTHLDEPGEALRFGSFGLGAIIHMFYTCWLGQMLLDHSEQIFLKA